jgi:plastocyanin
MIRPVSPRLRLSLLAAAAVLVAGCGSSKSLKVDGTRVFSIVEVSETEYSITPKTITLDRAGYYGIEAKNDGKLTHAIAVSGAGVDVRSAQIKPGKSDTILVLFKKPGRYTLFCPIPGHEAQGMKAGINVRT